MSAYYYSHFLGDKAVGVSLILIKFNYLGFIGGASDDLM